MEVQRDIVLCNNLSHFLISSKKELKDKLVQKTKLSVEEVGKICTLQEEIIQIKRVASQEGNRIINNYNIKGDVIQSIIGVKNVEIGGNFSPQMTSESKEDNVEVSVEALIVQQPIEKQ